MKKIILMLGFLHFLQSFILPQFCLAVSVSDLYPASKVYNAATKTWKIPATIRAVSNIATSEKTVALSMDLSKAANLGALVAVAGVAYLASEYIDWLMADKPSNWTVPSSGTGKVTKSVTNVIPPSNYAGYGLPPSQYIGNYPTEALAKAALVAAGHNLCMDTPGCSCWWSESSIDSIYKSNPKIYRGSKCTAPQVMFYATVMSTPNTETVVSDVTQNEINDVFDTKLADSTSANDPVIKAVGNSIDAASSLYPSGGNIEGKSSLRFATPAIQMAVKALLDSMINSGDAAAVQNDTDAMTEAEYLTNVQALQNQGLSAAAIENLLGRHQLSAYEIAAAIRVTNPAATAVEIATALSYQGLTAIQIADAIKMANPAATAAEIATAIQSSGLTANGIATAIRASNPAATAVEIAAALSSQGLTATQIADAIKTANPATTAADIAAAIRAANPAATADEIATALSSQGLTATQIADAIKTANPAATADEIAVAIKAANPAVTADEIAAAVKEAIKADDVNVDVPVDPIITLPEKLSLTDVLNSFMASINNLPMMSTLNGLHVYASGNSNLCLNLPSSLGGQKCFDLANFSAEFEMVGNALLGLTTLFSFMYVFKG